MVQTLKNIQSLENKRANLRRKIRKYSNYTYVMGNKKRVEYVESLYSEHYKTLMALRNERSKLMRGK
jgi:hypothetical protein